MIFPSEALVEQRRDILRRMRDGQLAEADAIEQMMALSPDDAVPYLVKASYLLSANREDEAEQCFWDAVERRPLQFMPYLAISDIRLKRDPQDPLGRQMRALGVWKLALGSEVPEEAAKVFAPLLEKVDADPHQPESYELLAQALEADPTDAARDEKVQTRLQPFRLLNELQMAADEGVEKELLDEVLANAERVIPLWRAALRDWGADSDVVAPELVSLLAASLGEVAGPELADDLMELGKTSDPVISVHACWALFRLGQRFPAEVLARYRATTAGADAGLRCMIAEELLLMPEVAGREDALADLVEGFGACVHHDDAPYLLMLVVYGLAEAEQEDRAHELLILGEAALTSQGRRRLRKMAEDEDFTPALFSLGLDELSINDVCVERALMPGGEDEEDEDEDAPPAVKPGRNDPCWCGSGKKYKKCHLAPDEEAGRQGKTAEEEEEEKPNSGRTEHQKVLMDVLEFAGEHRSRAQIGEAQRLFFGGEGGHEKEAAESGYWEWFLYDFRPGGSGPTLLEEYLRRRGPRVPAAERQLLENWRNARYGLYEVQRVEPGTGMELKDYFGEERFFVHDVSASRELVQWDTIFNRVAESEGKHVFSGNGTVVPRARLPQLAAQIEEGSRAAGQSPADYVRANSHLWYRTVKELCESGLRDLKVVNAEGDALEFCSAEYAVNDEGAVAGALEAAKVFEEGSAERDDAPGTRRFDWLEHAPEQSSDAVRRSYGSLTIAGGILRLECNSRKRLEIGRQLLEKHAGQWLQHRSDTFKSLAQAMKEKPPGKAAAKEPASVVPPEVEREMVLKIKAQHYATWADVPLPALAGKTPREAVRSAAGRKAVEDLLRDCENGEERERKRGRAAFDFTPIRKDLGLDRQQK
jgi:hypothetical protein